jgi:hypothetical protein
MDESQLVLARAVVELLETGRYVVRSNPLPFEPADLVDLLYVLRVRFEVETRLLVDGTPSLVASLLKE